MTDLEAILATIRDNPKNDFLRLMYADEVEDSDPYRAEFIRNAIKQSRFRPLKSCKNRHPQNMISMEECGCRNCKLQVKQVGLLNSGETPGGIMVLGGHHSNGWRWFYQGLPKWVSGVWTTRGFVAGFRCRAEHLPEAKHDPWVKQWPIECAILTNSLPRRALKKRLPYRRDAQGKWPKANYRVRIHEWPEIVVLCDNIRYHGDDYDELGREMPTLTASQ